MPILTIGDKSVTVGEEFTKLSPEQQNAAVADIAQSLGVTAQKAEPAEPVTANKAVRALATGVPVVGGVLNKLNAATNATLAPVVEPFLEPSENDISRKGETWAQRYRKSESMQNLADERFAAAHPVLDPALKITGAVVSAIPMMRMAPAAFGLTGTLPQMVMRGAASNAALAAADAGVRGEDVRAPAAVGALTGAGAPLVARGVGAGIRAFKEARNPTPPVRQNVEKVAGVDVPLTRGQAASDPTLQAEEEIMRRGARGGSAEAIARQADEAAKKALADATESISRSLDPRSLPAAADSNPVPPQFRIGTKDDTGPWFLGSDKPLYANATRDSLDRLYGPEVAAAFDKFPSVSGVNAKGQPITVWHKPGEEARALREIENFKTKGTVPADSAEAARLHYESGLNLGYPEPAARGYVEKRFGAGVLGEPSPRTAPQAAGETVLNEVSAQAMARQAAEDNMARQVEAQGETLARNLAGGAAPVAPFDAAERSGVALAKARADKIAATRAAYKARDAVEGTFDESVPQSMAQDIRERVNTGPEALWIDPTNEGTANKALRLIDQTVGRDSGMFKNAANKVPEAAPAAAAEAPGAAAGAKVAEDETTAALRRQYGDSVADAYAKQNKGAGEAAATKRQPLSLLQFIASKGGLKPHAELDAIGLASGHREQIPGESGFFGTVRKNGAEIDRMREAAEEAGYFRGKDGGTSTPTEFLDAIEAELRGQKRYPEGFEGFKDKKAAASQSARSTAEQEQMVRGFERDLEEAGYRELGPDVHNRTLKIMQEEGLKADDAVESALRQLEAEDAAVAAGNKVSDFPGDRPMRQPGAGESRPVDLKQMDEARKQLVTMLGDAKSKAFSTGDRSDLRAMSRILSEFDNVIEDALKGGKFSGDAGLAAELQAAARKSHAEYREMFTSRGAQDPIGRVVEKILGRYTDTAATPEQIMAMGYGPASRPGTGESVKVALRLRKVLPAEDFARWKQGLVGYVDDTSLSPAKRSQRINDFLESSMGRSDILTAAEKTELGAYARNLRAMEPRGGMVGEVDKVIAKMAAGDMTPVEVVDTLYSRTGKGDKGLSVRLGMRLKQDLTPEGWTAVRQGMWEKLVDAGEGKTPYGAQALSQRMHEFLNGSGKPLAQVMFSAQERAEMAKLASIYKRMAPMPGTTNPSGSATIGAKIARKALDNVGAMLGFGASGVPGAIAGHVLQRGGEMLKDARAGREAVRLFFGPQARMPIPTSKLPAIAAQALPASQR